MKAAIAILVVLGAVAHADKAKPATPTPEALIVKMMEDAMMNSGPSHESRFAFDTWHTYPLGGNDTGDLRWGNAEPKNTVIGLTATGTEAFVATDVNEVGDCGGDGGSCGKTIGWMHGALLFEKDADSGWLPRVWHLSEVVSAKEQKRLGDIVPPPFPRNVDGAEDVARLFESTIGDPKAFAKTVSDRKEVALFGSERADRVIGGAKVRAKLVAWNLTLTVRDGVQAGLSTGRTLAWVAANVDARSASTPKAKATPYRMLAIYERSGDAWKLVSVSFSIFTRS